LFYVSADNTLMATTLKTSGTGLEADTPHPLFPLMPQGIATGYEYLYDVAPDGRRFLVLQPIQEPKSEPLTVVINWQAGLSK
jgi:hypothetical protein